MEAAAEHVRDGGDTAVGSSGGVGGAALPHEPELLVEALRGALAAMKRLLDAESVARLAQPSQRTAQLVQEISVTVGTALQLLAHDTRLEGAAAGLALARALRACRTQGTHAFRVSPHDTPQRRAYLRAARRAFLRGLQLAARTTRPLLARLAARGAAAAGSSTAAAPPAHTS